MGKSVHFGALAAAIGFGLAGAGWSSETLHAAPITATAHSVTTPTSNGTQKYIVTFEEAGLLRYDGALSNLPSTMPKAGVNNAKLDVHSSAAKSYAGYLGQQRAAHLATIKAALGRELGVTHTYTVTVNAIAADMSPVEAKRVSQLPGVKSVRAAGTQKLLTYRGPTFIGANTIWNGTATPTNVGTRGQGIVAGDLDGGINSDHPSFANDTSCGFRQSAPKLIAVDCSATDTNGFCAGPNPEANPGFPHGVHTASTIVGNTINNTVTPAPLLPNGVSMSGVAPCAGLHHYKVCQTDSCGGADIFAGIQNAIADGVDVLNFSISGGTDPWLDNDRDFLDAVDANVFVAAAAGNLQAGETDPHSLVNHLGPWVMTVGASTQDQIIGPQLAVTGPGTVPPGPPDLGHILLTPGSNTQVPSTADFTGKAMISYTTNITGCTATGGFPANYFANSVALLQRGACSFVEKVTNAANAGAVLIVVANNQTGTLTMNTDGTPAVPAFSIDKVSGDALLAFVAANNPPAPNADAIFANGFEVPVAPATTVTNYSRAVASATQGDVIADFSYRGPVLAPTTDSTKPDITAPGVNIYAAMDDASGNYGFLSGTSMATPHVTGAAALVRAVHPDWSVMEVKSALMMTATNTNGVLEDGTTPWKIDDIGSGRVDLSKAALAGLTMDETTAHFLAANPDAATPGDVKTLNLPLLRNTACDTTGCSWTRVVRNRLSTSGSWTVTSATDASFTVIATPNTFTLAPGATQSIVFTATPNGSSSSIAFGNVNFHEGAAHSPDQHITVAVKSKPPQIAVTPNPVVADLAPNATTTTTFSVSNVGGGSLNWNFTSSGVGAVWDQPKQGSNGIFSDFSATDQFGAYSAGDFTVSSASAISKLIAYGFDNDNVLSSQTKITWAIYNDAGGKPDGNPDAGTGNPPVWTYSAAPGSAGVTLTDGNNINLNLAAAGQALNLPAGTYWLSVYPTYDDPFGASGSAWFWSGAAQKLNMAKLVGNSAFGIADWTNLPDLDPSITQKDVAFRVEGTITCGASWLQLSPTSGNNAGGTGTTVTATFNSAGVPDNTTLHATACIASNDPAQPLLAVPVSMIVHSAPICTQPLIDPSFETTSPSTFVNPSWPSADDRSGTPFCTADLCGGGLSTDGDWFTWFGGWSSGNETGNFSQTVTIPTGSSRYLNFYMLRTVPSTDTSVVSNLAVTIDSTQLAAYPKPTLSDAAYVAYSLPVPAAKVDGASHTVKFAFTKTGAGATGNVFIDQVSLDCAALPAGIKPFAGNASSIHAVRASQ